MSVIFYKTKSGLGLFNDYLFILKHHGRNKDYWKNLRLESLNKIVELGKKKTKSRAADMAKSRASAAGYIRDARLTERAAKSLESLQAEWGMTKTQVINKLLEESEQRQLL